MYHLEVCAYNNKTFRIPDNAGKQYNAEKINQKDELDHMLKCHLDLNDLMTKLKNHDIVLSTDPGRYLCNYVYFRSLDTLCSANKNAQSLFVHIPPTQHKSHEQNVSFVEALLHLLLKQ